MSHWHHVMVESKNLGSTVQVGTFASETRLGTKEAAADEVCRLLRQLTMLDETAIESARDGLLSRDEGAEIQRWADATRELHLMACPGDGCEGSVEAFRERLAERYGRPIVKPGAAWLG